KLYNALPRLCSLSNEGRRRRAMPILRKRSTLRFRFRPRPAVGHGRVPHMSVDVPAIANRLVKSVGTVIIGKQSEIELCVIGLLCRGHLLIEDVPGTGKTMLAKALSRATGCTFERVQFTPDLLPGDVIGVSVY